jgi:prophage regulatory protein
MENQSTSRSRILRLPEIIERTGLSRSAIYDIQNPKSPRHDPSFPKRFRLAVRSVGCFEKDLNDWINSRELARVNAISEIKRGK